MLTVLIPLWKYAHNVFKWRFLLECSFMCWKKKQINNSAGSALYCYWRDYPVIILSHSLFGRSHKNKVADRHHFEVVRKSKIMEDDQLTPSSSSESWEASVGASTTWSAVVHKSCNHAASGSRYLLPLISLWLTSASSCVLSSHPASTVSFLPALQYVPPRTSL